MSLWSSFAYLYTFWCRCRAEWREKRSMKKSLKKKVSSTPCAWRCRLLRHQWPRSRDLSRSPRLPLLLSINPHLQSQPLRIRPCLPCNGPGTPLPPDSDSPLFDSFHRCLGTEMTLHVCRSIVVMLCQYSGPGFSILSVYDVSSTSQ